MSLLRTRAFGPVSLALVATLGLSTAGCYNTYQVPQDEFRKLQSKNAINSDGRLQEKVAPDDFAKLQNRGENDPVVVESDKSDKVAVGRDTKVFVRSQGGRRYQLTTFNFDMSKSQLVASDRDTLLPLADIKAYEVDLLSTGKTVTMISVGVLGVAGFVAVLIATSGSKSFN
jgi:hypothetical protein